MSEDRQEPNMNGGTPQHATKPFFRKAATLDEAMGLFIRDFTRIAEAAKQKAKTLRDRMSARERKFNAEQSQDQLALDRESVEATAGDIFVNKLEAMFADARTEAEARHNASAD